MRYGEQFGFGNRPRRGQFEPGIGGQGAYGRPRRNGPAEGRYDAGFSGGSGGSYRGLYGGYGEFRRWRFGEGGPGDPRPGGRRPRRRGVDPHHSGRNPSELHGGTYRGGGPIDRATGRGPVGRTRSSERYERGW